MRDINELVAGAVFLAGAAWLALPLFGLSLGLAVRLFRWTAGW